MSWICIGEKAMLGRQSAILRHVYVACVKSMWAFKKIRMVPIYSGDSDTLKPINDGLKKIT